jgi:hypothetical protein
MDENMITWDTTTITERIDAHMWCNNNQNSDHW